MELEYNDALGRYRNVKTKKIVSKASVLLETEKESTRLKKQVQDLTLQMTNGELKLWEWEKLAAQRIKESHIRMSALGAGGMGNLTNAHYGSIGGILRKEYRLLNKFARGIEQGKYSPAYIVNRAGMYAASTRRSFFKGQQISRALSGVTLARRVLDAQAQHCPDCLAYATNGFVPIEDIVAPGEACRCGGRCRCNIIYKSTQRSIVNLSDRLDLIVQR